MKTALLLLLALQAAPEKVSFTPLGKGDRCDARDAALTVFTTQKEWEAAWAKLHPIKAPPAPAVDFHKEAAVFVSLGLEPSSGYGVEIVAIDKTAEEIRVQARRTLPDPKFKYAQALTRPWTAFRMETPVLKVTLIPEEKR
ncbi:MAG: protease complex subunit PrcB family protein [Planctomycetes bacterium]|nr:protease complex subunit PrcB family protein [Planctomycetota bacterium]